MDSNSFPVPVRVCGYFMLVAYLAYGIAGILLERRAHGYALRPPPRDDRFNPTYYAPDGHGWVARSERWHRWRWAAWIGGGLAIAIGCRVFG